MTEWMCGCLLREWTNQTQERTMSEPSARVKRDVQMLTDEYERMGDEVVACDYWEDRVCSIREVLEDLISVCDDAIKERNHLLLAGNPALQRAKDVLFKGGK